MRHRFTILLLTIALLALFAVTPVRANPAQTPHVQAELGSVMSTIKPGASFWVVLQLRMQAGWHTYWQNPGDAGLATTIDWTLPEGFMAGSILWPYPHRLPVGPVMNYGYSGEVALLTRVTAPSDLPPGQNVTLQAAASWVVCAEICIPESVTLDLALPVKAGKPQPDQRWQDVFAAVQPLVPQPAPWQVAFSGDPDTLTLLVTAPALATVSLTDVAFFPLTYGVIDHAAPQRVQRTEQGLRLTLQRGTFDTTHLTRLEGVLVLYQTQDSAPRVQAFTIRAGPEQAS